MKYMQQYVKEHVDTPLCNVNRAEKGTVTLDEDQGEVHSVGRATRLSMFGVQNIVDKMAVEERIRSSRAPKPRMDRVCRTRLAKSCGSRDDSPSWNLSRVKQGGAIRVTTWIHGGEGVRWRSGRRVAVRQQDDAQVDQTNQCIEATGAARSEQLGGAQDLRQEDGLAMGFVSGDRTRRRSCLLRGQHKHGRSKKLHSNRLHQTCGPVNQQRHVCVEKCPLTMRHVAKRSGDSCGELQQSFGEIMTREAGAKHAKHDRIRTQADHQSRMTSVRGKQTDLHAQSLEGTQVVLVSPADQPAQRRARAAELWRIVRKRTRGSARGRANSLSATRARVKATPESHRQLRSMSKASDTIDNVKAKVPDEESIHADQQ